MTRSDSPLVSVCVATYNQDRYIKDGLVSVLAQLPDVSLEILVGDDGTGPETPGIVQRLMERHPGVIQYFRHEKNLGASANYQFLVARAQGRYIAHLDGDDHWLPGKLAVQIAWLEDHPESLACYGNAVVVDEQGVVAGAFSSRIRHPIDLDFLLVQGNFLNHSSMLYRASHRQLVLDLPGPFIDYRMHLDFARHGVLGFCNRAVAVYRKGAETSMLRTAPESVRQLYFEALTSALASPSVSADVRFSSLVHFWRGVFRLSLSQLNFALARAWVTRLRTAYPHEYAGIILWGAAVETIRLPALPVRKLRSWLARSNGLQVMHER